MSKATLVATIFTMVASCSLLLPRAMAHAPLSPGDNESLATAAEIPDPSSARGEEGKKALKVLR